MPKRREREYLGKRKHHSGQCGRISGRSSVVYEVLESTGLAGRMDVKRALIWDSYFLAATGIRDEELKRKAEEQISPHDQFSPGCPEVWLFSIL